ncbi:MAG: hypothetical protein JXR51_10980 [Bacteroidales bacterium]|nr:hypothetical protein [Bacteroidales bacterium]MBN2757692.1 hypothetical protein [Bacteroidales bacterium]
MSQNKIIETIGYITKEEKLANLKHNILTNIFVIETIEAFPGYHGTNLPEDSKVPEFIFLITKQKYSTEFVARASKNISEYFKYGIDIAKGEINAFNTKLPCIRLRKCKNFENLPELVSCFKDEGFKFAKSQNIDDNCIIHVLINFNIEEISEGIYKDLEKENTFYLTVPMKLKWQQFKTITFHIKNNLDNNNFDAAQGFFYRKNNNIEDVVRIYDKESNIKALSLIKEKYLNEYKKVILNKF